jgi:mRNA-degrading endonuclease RelE of RelBE toxin-antitoxin system
MKTKNKTKITINAIGNGFRLLYLEKNPHGFVSVTKVHKSSKQYSRKNKSKNEIQNIFG